MVFVTQRFVVQPGRITFERLWGLGWTLSKDAVVHISAEDGYDLRNITFVTQGGQTAGADVHAEHAPGRGAVPRHVGGCSTAHPAWVRHAPDLLPTQQSDPMGFAKHYPHLCPPWTQGIPPHSLRSFPLDILARCWYPQEVNMFIS